MSEYGEQKSLQEILEELVVCCFNLSPLANLNDIELVLPKSVLEKFTQKFTAKTKFLLDEESKNKSDVKSLNVSGGAIRLHSSEDVEVKLREKS